MGDASRSAAPTRRPAHRSVFGAAPRTAAIRSGSTSRRSPSAMPARRQRQARPAPCRSSAHRATPRMAPHSPSSTTRAGSGFLSWARRPHHGRLRGGRSARLAAGLVGDPGQWPRPRRPAAGGAAVGRPPARRGGPRPAPRRAGGAADRPPDTWRPAAQRDAARQRRDAADRRARRSGRLPAHRPGQSRRVGSAVPGGDRAGSGHGAHHRARDAGLVRGFHPEPDQLLVARAAPQGGLTARGIWLLRVDGADARGELRASDGTDARWLP